MTEEYVNKKGTGVCWKGIVVPHGSRCVIALGKASIIDASGRLIYQLRQKISTEKVPYRVEKRTSSGEPVFGSDGQLLYDEKVRVVKSTSWEIVRKTDSVLYKNKKNNEVKKDDS